ncbi:MAG: hypothetical protein R3C18_11490 [Planctomycetaceae bacterium]
MGLTFVAAGHLNKSGFKGLSLMAIAVMALAYLCNTQQAPGRTLSDSEMTSTYGGAFLCKRQRPECAASNSRAYVPACSALNQMECMGSKYEQTTSTPDTICTTTPELSVCTFDGDPDNAVPCLVINMRVWVNGQCTSTSNSQYTVPPDTDGQLCF